MLMVTKNNPKVEQEEDNKETEIPMNIDNNEQDSRNTIKMDDTTKQG